MNESNTRSASSSKRDPGSPQAAPGTDRIIDSPLLSASGFRHAFFSRQGGVSAPPYDSLNFSMTVGDREPDVAANLARAASDLLCLPHHIVFLHQVHGVDCHIVHHPNDSPSIRSRSGDAVLSRHPDVACAVRFADCAPILIGDLRSGAVAAVHSGWRGTLLDIASVALHSLERLTGAPLDPVAAIGPHIEACCFEVGHDVAAQLRAASPDPDILRTGKRDRPHVDLRAMIHAQLLRAGVSEDRIDHVRGCTVCDRERFFSYRRDGERGGRHLAAIVARRQR